jgi:hypothetical protein
LRRLRRAAVKVQVCRAGAAAAAAAAAAHPGHHLPPPHAAPPLPGPVPPPPPLSRAGRRGAPGRRAACCSQPCRRAQQRATGQLGAASGGTSRAFTAARAAAAVGSVCCWKQRSSVAAPLSPTVPRIGFHISHLLHNAPLLIRNGPQRRCGLPPPLALLRLPADRGACGDPRVVKVRIGWGSRAGCSGARWSSCARLEQAPATGGPHGRCIYYKAIHGIWRAPRAVLPSLCAQCQLSLAPWAGCPQTCACLQSHPDPDQTLTD